MKKRAFPLITIKKFGLLSLPFTLLFMLLAACGRNSDDDATEMDDQEDEKSIAYHFIENGLITKTGTLELILTSSETSFSGVFFISH
ncbi:hypothetical protein [Domibacillus mangrovi]|uniref:Uncharacterized protein n=1 Tax=Domibacillus mangrovi TaxID=1714354 RepID=A0A1Q5P4M1_9BACI|nr:hypothetical protein [Domibacillus mangrovi]OKL37220.1 hypothetical protein BLL40_06485 [Domibacillus mangrovi]